MGARPDLYRFHTRPGFITSGFGLFKIYQYYIILIVLDLHNSTNQGIKVVVHIHTVRAKLGSVGVMSLP